MLSKLYFSLAEEKLDVSAQLAACHKASLELPFLTHILDDQLLAEKTVNEYCQVAKMLPYRPGLHGPFIDVLPGSPDKKIQQVARERCLATLEAACRIGVAYVVFHANFNPLIHSSTSLMSWVERSADFWNHLLCEAPYSGTILLENMCEPSPEPLQLLIDAISRENVKVCLDTGHVNVFSLERPSAWLAILTSRLSHIHLNDNHSQWDEEAALGTGTFDFTTFFAEIQRQDLTSLSFTIESPFIDVQKASYNWMLRHQFFSLQDSSAQRAFIKRSKKRVAKDGFTARSDE